MPEQKYGAAEKEAAVYSEDQKESGTLSGSNADDSRTGKGYKKNIPTKAEDFLDGFGETVVLSAGASKQHATLVSREPGELVPIYLERDITVIGKLETAADAVINIPTVDQSMPRSEKGRGHIIWQI